jgi:hypothetical protein
MKRFFLLVPLFFTFALCFGVNIAINLHLDVTSTFYQEQIQYYDYFYYPFNDAPQDTTQHHINGYPPEITSYDDAFPTVIPNNSNIHFYPSYTGTSVDTTHFIQNFFIPQGDTLSFVSVLNYQFQNGDLVITEYATEYCQIETYYTIVQEVHGIVVKRDESVTISGEYISYDHPTNVEIAGFTFHQILQYGSAIPSKNKAIYLETRNVHITECVFGSRDDAPIVLGQPNNYLNYFNSVYGLTNGKSASTWIIDNCSFDKASKETEYVIYFDKGEENYVGGSDCPSYFGVIDNCHFSDNDLSIYFEKPFDYCFVDNYLINSTDFYYVESSAIKVLNGLATRLDLSWYLDNFSGLFPYYPDSGILNNTIINYYTPLKTATERYPNIGIQLIENNTLDNCFNGFINICTEEPETNERKVLYLRNVVKLSLNGFPNSLFVPYTNFSAVASEFTSTSINNTFISDIDMSQSNSNSYIIGNLISEFDVPINEFINCVVSGFNQIAIPQVNLTEVSFDFCLSNLSLGNDCIVATDPLLDASFTPIWSTSSKSPCINAGCTLTDSDDDKWWQEDVYSTGVYHDLRFDNTTTPQDRDLSRKDIGAKPYLPVDANGDYIVENSVITLDHDRPNWICLPGIDSLRTEEYWTYSGEDSTSYHFGEQSDINLFSDQPFYLDNIFWNYFTDGFIQYENGWSNLTEPINSVKGYKIDFTANLTNDVMLEFDGFKPGSDYNQQKYVTLAGRDTLEFSHTTLAGYYLRKSQHINSAIPENILVKTSCIKTRDWFALNVSYLNSNMKTTWSIGTLDGNTTLNYGDAVEFIYRDTEDATFEWLDSPQPIVPVIEELPTCFTYEEMPDYYPIFIEMDLDEYEEGNKPIEIAIFVDDECKGASIIKSDDVHLKAYVVNDPDLIGEDITFQLQYSYSKGDRKTVNEYAVMDMDEHRFVTKTLKVNNDTDFAHISFSSKDISEGVIPLKTSLQNNFPNPFNPTTTIKYNVAKETDVELSIYNIRGQKVKTLVNEHLNPGYHSVIWDGTDKNKKSVASGVYFYRLKADHKTLTKKMMLLK